MENIEYLNIPDKNIIGIKINHDLKIILIYVTKNYDLTISVQNKYKNKFDKYKNYFVGTFVSGDGNIKETIKNIITYEANKKGLKYCI